MTTPLAPNVMNLPKPPGDIDLVMEVRNLLSLYNVPEDKIRANFDQNQYIELATGKLSSVQLFFMNRYWTLQLMSVQKNTTDLRIYLIKEHPDLWLEYFKTRLINFIILNELPTSVSL